ncbi:HEPN domain-containing protein [Puia dinghuensis]|uniref:UPF0332 protein n=1 Tax=Puia dinghuensis TaxID=1792502 RepID=A0A8J2UB50_9BACT|nr:HEPN domain-containing protein [Puia dinghuensis]GGA92322.1 UPF0332 protein [Puia dinghuensis]
MNEQDKAELVNYRIHRARATYDEVQILVANKLWNTAVNRLYYSCFYAVIALLAANNVEVNSHSGARQMFGLNFIRTNIIDQDLGRFFTRLFDLRQTGDYDDFIDFNEEKVLELLGPAEKLISRIENLLGQ